MCLLSRNFLYILFFFHDTAPTEIYTLSLHDALPICKGDYQGAAIRSVRPVERTGEGGLRSGWVDGFGHAGIEGKRRLWPGRAGPRRSDFLRGQRFARLSLPVLLCSARDAGNVSRRGTARR